MIIYKTTNLINNKIYIGLDSKNNDKYFGSGVLLKQAIKKHGIVNFTKETIDKSNDINDLYNKEKYWVEFYNSTDRDIGYNIKPGGFGNSGYWNGLNLTDTHKKNISIGINKSEKFKKSRSSDEYRTKIKIARNNSEKVKSLIYSKEFSELCRLATINSELWQAAMKDPNRGIKISNSLKNSEKFKESMKSDEFSQKCKNREEFRRLSELGQLIVQKTNNTKLQNKLNDPDYLRKIKEKHIITINKNKEEDPCYLLKRNEKFISTLNKKIEEDPLYLVKKKEKRKTNTIIKIQQNPNYYKEISDKRTDAYLKKIYILYTKIQELRPHNSLKEISIILNKSMPVINRIIKKHEF